MSAKILPAVVLGAFLAAATSHGAVAQIKGCEDGGKLMTQRQALIARINSFKKTKMNPMQACSIFGELAGNHNRLVDWLTANASWCNIPPQAIENIKAQGGQIMSIRSKACGAVAQYKKMEQLAKQRAEQAAKGGGGAFAGGDDVTGGPRRLPQGAL